MMIKVARMTVAGVLQNRKASSRPELLSVNVVVGAS